MVDVNKNIFLKSMAPIVSFFILSCIVHILFGIFLIYKLSYYVDDFVKIKGNYQKVILMSSSNDIDLNTTLKTKKISKKSVDIASIKKNQQSDIYIRKNLNNFNNDANADSNFMSSNKNNLDNKSNKYLFKQSTIVNEKSINVLRKPLILKCVYPEYPNQAKILGIEGKLIVMYDVNSTGRVENIRILSAIPVGIFEKNIKLSMCRWIFESKKSQKDLIVNFRFSLNKVQMFDN